MKKWFIVLLCIEMLFLFAEKEEKYIPGEFVVKGNLINVQNSLKDKGLTVENILKIDDTIYQVILTDKNINITKLCEELQKTSHVDFIQANWVHSLHEINAPKDTYWLQQWALDNMGQDSPSGAQGMPDADISALKAWELTKGSSDIIVGVIDTGIDYTHPDLKNNMWINEAELSGIDGKDDDGNGYTDDKYGWNFITSMHTRTYHGQLGHPDPMDDNSHGTHCAGIIGAEGNNFKGVSGVNWDVRLMALKFLNKDGFGSSADAYRAVMYAIRNNVDILSNSWGGSDKDTLLEFAVQKAKNHGILFVVAAGNERSNNDDFPSYPANYNADNIISVAATDNKDRIANFSNYGAASVHIAAPGVSIMSTIPTNSNNKDKFAYAAYSGTSMAAPYVSGAAALLLAKEPSLRKKPLEIKKRLLSTVDVLPQLSGLVSSQGRLNLYNALTNKVNDFQQSDNIRSKKLEITAPRFNEELFDKTWEVKESGAQYLRVHFDWLIADIPNVDFIAVYDSSYNLIFQFEKQYPQGIWTPWIKGDTLYIRFANALVAIETFEEQEFKTPEEGFKAGATSCMTYNYGQPDAKTICYISKLSKPFANFESHGFVIDKMEFVNQENKDEK